MTSTDIHVRAAAPRVALGVLAAVAISLIANTGVALLTRSLVHDGTQTGLMPIAYGPLTAIGVLAGTAGWATVRRYAARPRAVLRVLVPAVVVVSLVPGIVLLAIGNSPVNVIGLWVMHLVVAVVTLLTVSRVLPLRDKDI